MDKREKLCRQYDKADELRARAIKEENEFGDETVKHKRMIREAETDIRDDREFFEYTRDMEAVCIKMDRKRNEMMNDGMGKIERDLRYIDDEIKGES